MNPLHKEIIERIKSDGPLPFAAFMQIALYDSRHGYYSSGAQRTGWRGHFITSPELDPSFGILWAHAFHEIWIACGAPDRFEIVEIGPGEGGFANAVIGALDERFKEVLTYRLVERVAAVRDRQRELLGDGARLEWTDSITELPQIPAGCVFANEVLDNLPVHLVEIREGAPMEMMVNEADDELIFDARPPSNPELVAFLERNAMSLGEGERAEITLAAESLITRVGRLLGAGALLFVDYGMWAEDIAARGGSLVAYSSAGADTDVLASPGEKDITAHANWTSVTNAMRRSDLAPTAPVAQREVLLRLGARDLEASFRRGYDAAISEGHGAVALSFLSRRQALGALLDPGGLGNLQVLAGLRAIEPPAFLT
ncbi:MAG: hypothetical protein QOG16_683 [Actinomycetota bacterium]|nr:hypothetical protein [Actinomycetota bacterium]